MSFKLKPNVVVTVVAVLGIVAVLVGLLFPAIHGARESGRELKSAVRNEAASNLNQFGLALKNNQDSLAPEAGEAASAPATASYAADAAPTEAPTRAAVAPQPTAPADSRLKIIYTAMIQLDVEDLSVTGDKVADLVKKCGGYVADSNVSGMLGETRHARYSVRVPADRFDEFVASAKSLGELIAADVNSQDVTEEYYDVEARIRNKTREEERLLKLLEDRPGKLEDVIAIERELSRVRGEFEQMQGRIRYLADRTSLTTVQLVLSEVHGYQPEESPTLATRAGRSFTGSITALQSLGELFVVGIVALAPWLAVFAAIGAAAYALLRPILRRASAPTSST